MYRFQYISSSFGSSSYSALKSSLQGLLKVFQTYWDYIFKAAGVYYVQMKGLKRVATAMKQWQEAK